MNREKKVTQKLFTPILGNCALIELLTKLGVGILFIFLFFYFKVLKLLLFKKKSDQALSQRTKVLKPGSFIEP